MLASVVHIVGPLLIGPFLCELHPYLATGTLEGCIFPVLNTHDPTTQLSQFPVVVHPCVERCGCHRHQLHSGVRFSKPSLNFRKLCNGFGYPVSAHTIRQQESPMTDEVVCHPVELVDSVTTWPRMTRDKVDLWKNDASCNLASALYSVCIFFRKNQPNADS